ncbi:MAG: HalD/BesD family halogenase [Egibacteraceae bacterium]
MTNEQALLFDIPRFQESAIDLCSQFCQEGYVPLPGLVTDHGMRLLVKELRDLERVAKRRDFRMMCMDNSPRHMTTVGGVLIAKESKLISTLYTDVALIRFLRQVTLPSLVVVPDPIERHVANYLHRPGDTHGAHFDHNPVALVIFVEAPDSPDDGGLLEYVPNATCLSALQTGKAKQAFHRPGDGYVLRSDTSAHRVTPLTGNVRRVVLNFAYTTPETAKITDLSAGLLYD